MKKILFLIAGLLLVTSCATDIRFELPQGPAGPAGKDGKSAYEVWVDAVGKGQINWNGGTAMSDFFRYLKGEPGQNGASAYDTWREYIADGSVDDPHNPGKKWAANRNSMVDFYQFLTGKAGADGINGINGGGGGGIAGKDGKSAFELWLELVDAGLITPDDWDGTTKLELLDMFLWLKGKDGTNGTVGGVEGEPGKSAYDLWKEDFHAGRLRADWTGTDDSYEAFWDYLRGKDGKDGKDGTPGTPGEQGIQGLSAYELWLVHIVEGDISWDGDLTIEGYYEYLKGSQGENGKSAYEMWIEMVLAGQIDYPEHLGSGQWPATDISIIDFYIYLTGAPGVMGPQGPRGFRGEDGTDGLSAWELWQQMVKVGIDDPHNPGSQWPAGKISETDFFEYLTGAQGTPGLTAFELWLLAVEVGVDDPHNPGNEWPKDKIDVTDYYEFFRGLKGDTGEDGNTIFITIMSGMLYAFEMWAIDVRAGKLKGDDGNVLSPYPGGFGPGNADNFNKFLEFIKISAYYLTLTPEVAP